VLAAPKYTKAVGGVLWWLYLGLYKMEKEIKRQALSMLSAGVPWMIPE